MAVNLEKSILPGTWRYLGQIHSKLPIQGVPIAGQSAKEIQAVAGGVCLRIGRTDVRNAFVLSLDDGRRLLYVRPQWNETPNSQPLPAFDPT